MKIQPSLPRLLGVLAATYVTLTIIRIGSLADPMRELMRADSSLEMRSPTSWIMVSVLSALLAPLLALLSDVVPLRKTRRRSWLLLATGGTILFWLVLAGTPQKYSMLFPVETSLSLAAVLFRVSGGGLAADAGQTYGATGTVGGIGVIATNAGALLLLALRPVLAARGLTWIALFSAGILLAFGGLAARALTFEPRPPGSVPRASVAFRAMLSSRSFWLSGLLFFLVGAASDGMAVYVRVASSWTKNASGALMPMPRWVSPVVLVLAGLAYFWLCRRLPLRGLLLATVGLTAAATATALSTISISSILIGLASIPLMDLGLRAVQPGIEALGLVLLQFASAAGGAVLGSLLATLLSSLPAGAVLTVFLAVSIAAVVPVLLLPSALVSMREGEILASSGRG